MSVGVSTTGDWPIRSCKTSFYLNINEILPIKEVGTYRGEKAAASADTRDCFMRKSMTQETNQSPRPLFCTTGCGFYGSARTNGMCSICYNLQRQDSGGTGSDSVPPSLSSLGETLSTHSASAWEESRSESLVTRMIREEETALGSHVETPGTSQTEQNSDVADSHASAQASTSNLESKPVKMRCFVCRKKVGLTGFDCRCGNMYCSLHRYSDVHNCTFDYKAEGAKKIKKENPVVNGEKIQKF